MKNTVERGASWTLEETKLLLSFWGNDLVKRQATNTKRTKETYDMLSAKLNQSGYERTTDQVRTRIFNMIAEYRRLDKKPDPVRLKKCAFFESLKKIYKARSVEDVKEALELYKIDDVNCFSPYSSTSSNYNSDVETDINSSSTSNTAAANNNNTINTSTIILSNTVYNDADAGSAASATAAANASTTTNVTSTQTAPNLSCVKKDKESNAQKSNSSHAAQSGAPSPHKKHKADHSTDNQTHHSSAKAAKGNQNNNSTQATLASTPTTGFATLRQNSLLLHQPATSIPCQTPSSVNKKIPTTTTSTAALNTSNAAFFNLNSTALPILRAGQIIGHPNNTVPTSSDAAAAGAARLPTTAIASQLYQAPVTTFDVTSSALLIDRMFAHLSKESQNMREWIALEKERLALERSRRQQENERELKREKALVDTLIKFQEQWLSFVSHLDPRIVASATTSSPKLNNLPENKDDDNNDADQK